MKAVDPRGNPVRCSGCGSDEIRIGTYPEVLAVREDFGGTMRLRGVFTCCSGSWWVEAVLGGGRRWEDRGRGVKARR